MSDARELADLFAANRSFLEPFDPVRPDAFFTPEGQLGELRRAEDERARGTGYAFGIEETGTGALVGRIALSNVVRSAWGNATIGYFVGEPWNGRGYATAAVAQVLRVAFGDLGLHRVQAAVLPANAASTRVLERNGFRREGLAERYLNIAGRWQDHVILAITSEEWTGGPSASAG